MKKHVLLHLLALIVIAIGGITLAASAPYGVVAQEDDPPAAECKSNSGNETCTGKTCCADENACYANLPDICKALFCEDNPGSSICPKSTS